jgi:hypothetical protein
VIDAVKNNLELAMPPHAPLALFALCVARLTQGLVVVCDLLLILVRKQNLFGSFSIALLLQEGGGYASRAYLWRILHALICGLVFGGHDLFDLLQIQSVSRRWHPRQRYNSFGESDVSFVSPSSERCLDMVTFMDWLASFGCDGVCHVEYLVRIRKFEVDLMEC